MAMQEVASDAFLKKHGLKGAGETSMPAAPGGGLSCSAGCSHPLQVATSLRRSRAPRSKRSSQSEFTENSLMAAPLSDDRGRVQFPG